MEIAFNKRDRHSIYEQNSFYAIFEQQGNYFLYSFESHKSCLIENCEDMEDAIIQYADVLEAAPAQARGPIKSKDAPAA